MYFFTENNLFRKIPNEVKVLYYKLKLILCATHFIDPKTEKMSNSFGVIESENKFYIKYSCIAFCKQMLHI